MLSKIMFNRFLVGNLRTPGKISHSFTNCYSPKSGELYHKSQVRFSAHRTINSSAPRTSMTKCSLVLRVSIGLCSGTGIKLFTNRGTAYCTAVQQSKITNLPVDRFDWEKFWSMLKPYLLQLIMAIASALIVAMLNIRIPLELGNLINIMTNLVANNLMTQYNLTKCLMGPTLRLLSLYGSQALFTFIYIYLLAMVGERVAATMKMELFASVLSQDIAYFDSQRTGEIVNRLTVDVQDFKSSFKLCVSQGIRSIMQIVGCSISLFFISPHMTGGMLILVPIIIVAGTRLGTILRKMSVEAQAQTGKATLVCDQAISNIRTVRAFAMEEAEFYMFAREVEDASHLNEALGLGIGIFQGATNLFLNGMVLGTLFVGAKLWASNRLTAGDMMAFLVATQTIQRSLAQLSLLFGQVMKGMAAGARVFGLINLEPLMPLKGGKKIPFHSVLGNVEFRNVWFTYPTRPEQNILEDFCLHIPPGSTLAVVGTSGNGKSTIAALLERFYDVDQGCITIDGIDIKDLDPLWLRGKAIGFINQEPVLFAGTIMENIRYGKKDATDEEVIEVAKLAKADEFICSFPEGYDTVLGERGVTVSGGQKQRIAIARALIKNPSILILDEATSALDAESEKLVQDALNTLARGRTVLVIAHRLSTVKDADMIVVLNNGKIVEMGTHDELTAKKGIYWNLFQQQSSSVSKKDGA